MGTGLPNTDTDTFSLDFSSLTSSTNPLNEAKGPSHTFTRSPMSKDICVFGAKVPSLILPNILFISFSETGAGDPVV